MNFPDLAGLAILLVRPGMLVIATPFLGAVSAPTITRVGLTVLIALMMAPVVSVPADLPLFAGSPRPVLVNADEKAADEVERALGRRPELRTWK